MRAGKLDRRITIQRVTTAPNAFNEPVETWIDVATVWAQQRPNRGSERFSAQEINGRAVLTFHIRYRGDVTVQNRILYRGRSWNILDIREIGRRVVTEIDVVTQGEEASP
jgi:SPP1 family predicted phage head-tail adaptor